MPIPTTMPADLSETGRKVYRRAIRDYGRTIQRFHDEETLLGAKEIAEAGLGRFQEPTGSESYQGGYLWVTPLAKHFTAIRTGRTHPDYLYVEVEVLEDPRHDDGILLAALHGVDLAQRDRNGRNPMTIWEIQARHATGTDFEHSSMHLADLTITNPSLGEVRGTRTTLYGTLTEMRAYAFGVDPFSVAGDYSEPGETCSYEQCQQDGEAHQIGRFLPPENSDFDAYLGKAVKVTATPLALVDGNGSRTAADEQ